MYASNFSEYNKQTITQNLRQRNNAALLCGDNAGTCDVHEFLCFSVQTLVLIQCSLFLYLLYKNVFNFSEMFIDCILQIKENA